MDIYYLTSNKGKIESAKLLLKDKNINIIAKNIDFEEPDVNDIDYIAEAKVRYAYSIIKKPCIANDSGFYINAWPLEKDWPGAKVHRELVNKVGIDGVLKVMENVEDRTCYFKQTLAFFDGSTLKLFHGMSLGSLQKFRSTEYKTDKRWSELWEIFIPKGYNVAMSQFTEDMMIERSNNNKDDEVLVKFKKWICEDYLKQ